MDAGPCLLVLEDSSSCIFGAFVSEGLRPRNHCHGTNESFLFRYPRAAGAWRTEVFRWCHSAEARSSTPSEAPPIYQGARPGFFEALQKIQMSAAAASLSNAEIYCDHSGIVIGIDGPAIFVDQDLLRGVSCPSKAFDSPCMAAAGSGPDFVIRNLEVWHWAAS